MKRLIIGLLIISFYIIKVWANATTELQLRLNKINSFQADFLQKTTSNNGDLIYQSKGHLWIKRPNLFNWHTISPNENWLISNGVNLWFYNPLIEQVTVTSLSKVTIDIPFILITHNNRYNWKHYYVNKYKNDFQLKKIQNNTNLEYFSITILPSGKIQRFSSVEKNGQTNLYQLINQNKSQIHNSIFKFIPPKGTEIDDQRLIK